MTKQQRLTGIFTPNLIPLTEEDQINEPELRRFVDWLIEAGVHGLYPNGSTGEFLRFTPEERKRTIEIITDQNQGRVTILAGAAETNLRETIKACEYYASLNVRAVAIVAPYYFKLSQDAIYAYYKEIACNSPVDVTLYNIPVFTNVIEVATVQRLADECDRIIGIKDSSGDFTHMMRMIRTVRPNRPDFSFITGCEQLLLPMLMMGCDGGTHGITNVFPKLTRKLYDLSIAGEFEQAKVIQYHIAELFDLVLLGQDFPDGFRVGTELRGFKLGPGRQPMTEAQRLHLVKLKTRLQTAMQAADQLV